MIVFVLHLPSPPRSNKAWAQLVWSFDPIGQLLFLTSIVCVLLALQRGGTTYAWASARIIALLVVFALFFVDFMVNEIKMGSDATIPPKVASQRTVAAASCFAFFNYAQFFIFVSFIPIYFQASRAYPQRNLASTPSRSF